MMAPRWTASGAVSSLRYPRIVSWAFGEVRVPTFFRAAATASALALVIPVVLSFVSCSSPAVTSGMPTMPSAIWAPVGWSRYRATTSPSGDRSATEQVSQPYFRASSAPGRPRVLKRRVRNFLVSIGPTFGPL